MDFSDYRKSIDVIETGMEKTSTDRNFYFFTEEAAVGELELTNKQIKQLFMIMGQASEFEKTQGSLKGYVSSIDADKLDIPDEEIQEDHIDEVDPLGRVSGLAGGIKSRIGTERSRRKAKMTVAAKEAAKLIWDEWEKESISAGVRPTVSNIATWLKNKKVGDNILDVAFTNIGVTNVMSYIGDAEKPEVDADNPLSKWMEDNNVVRGSLDGRKSVAFLKSMGISGAKIKNIVGELGLAKIGSRTISKDQYNKLNDVAKSTLAARRGFETDDIITSWLEKEFINPEDFTGLNAFDFVREQGVNNQIANRLFDRIGIEQSDDYIITSDDKAKLVKLVDIHGGKPEVAPDVDTEEEVIDKTEEIVSQAGGSIGKAKTSAQRQINADDIAGMTELQKLGIAVLAARDKVKL